MAHCGRDALRPPPPSGMSEPVPRRTLGTGAALATVSQLVAALGGGLMGLIIARLLGPAGTGRVNVVLTAVLILGAVSSLGIELGVNYHVGGKRWAAATALRQTQLAALGLGLVGGLIGLGLGLAGHASVFRGVSIGVLALGLAALPFMLSWTFSSLTALAVDRYEAYAAAPAAQALLGLALAAALVPPLGVEGAVAAATLAHVLVACGMLRWGLRRLGRPEAGWPREARRRNREAARFGVRAYAGNVLQLVNYRADLLILNAVASHAAVGRYAVAVSVTALGQIVPRALASVLLPRVAALDDGTEHAALELSIVKSVRHAILISTATGVVLALGLLLVPLLYGSGFDDSVALGLLLVPGICFIGVGGVLSSTIIGRGHPEYALRNVLVVTPLTLALYGALIPTLGATGAAVASSVSYVAATLVAWHYFRRVTDLRATSLRPGREELGDYVALARRGRGRRGRRAG